MKKIKILLADPKHKTVGAHSYFIPIGIGYIGAYLLQEIKEYEIDLKLSIDSDEIFNLIEEWRPDIIGISNYVWNANLSNMMCEFAKEKNQNILTILGGPQFPAGTGARKIENTSKDQTYDKCFKYLIDRPGVDYFAYCDGEVTVVELVNKFIQNKLSINLMKNKDEAIKGCASISLDKKKLLVGEYFPRIGMEGSIKKEGRDVIPSPYLTGLLDKFLDGKLSPALETSRGCPFLCTFCDQGLDMSKMATLSVKRLTDELNYIAERVHDTGTKRLEIFDANWGMFQKDIDFADKILEVMEKYDWPKEISCTTPKSKKENLLLINDKLKNRVTLSLSMQSLNMSVLGNIKRKNWERDQYIEWIAQLKKRGRNASNEMIMPLPGETEESYFAGVKFLMDNNIPTQTYTLMMLCGADLGRDEAIKKYNMKSKYRIIPKAFSEYYGKKTFEIERVCVGTSTMSYESYLNCRNFSFIVRLLGHPFLYPVTKLTQKIGLSWFEFSKELADTIQSNNSNNKFKEIYEDFCKESHNELFDSEKEAIEFYSKPKNFKLLINGDIGENLIAKYIGQSLLALEDIFTVIFQVIRRKLNKELAKNESLNSILNNSEKWLKNLYLVNDIISNKEINENKYEIKMDFDFPAWLTETTLPFEKFSNQTIYKMSYDVDKVKYMRNEIENLFGLSQDKNRAFGKYILRGSVAEIDSFKKSYTRLS
jgi:radical SAM superfamily enzyme YgiQ (UPF0313 family)